MNNKILNWIDNINRNINVQIAKSKFSESNFWFYDENSGRIRNKNNSFFSITGLREYEFKGDKKIIIEQPVIVQDEIGYLGIICKEIDGIMHFLMQAKIEPGNINKVQISPTIQATKSNFTQKHGGKKPAYIDYFINSNKYKIIVDQIQSEQSSRFFRKRNRNIIICIDDEIDVLPTHRWMTLGEIKALMKIDNLVNMDTRTVLSCIPFYKFSQEEYLKWNGQIRDISLYNSIFNNDDNTVDVFNKINNFKMFSKYDYEFIKIKEMKNWVFTNSEIVCKIPHPYKVIFCDIAIDGREVSKWQQPLFAANGNAVFGLFVRIKNDKKEFLVKLKHEIGCFDNVELGPSVQIEAVNNDKFDAVETKFLEMLNKHQGIIFDHYLSEEGGRFYHEQNRNILILLDDIDSISLSGEYMWLDYKTLNILVQSNNVLNIQLRNLISLLEA